MTPADVESIRAALEAVAAGWLRRAVEKIDAKVSDARAHAANALTERLRAEADGRPTIRLGAKSRSFAAALARLDELLIALVGPSEVSLAGLVRDAREDLYRHAFALHREHVPSELHIRPDPEPTAANVVLIRTTPIHGKDPHAELMRPFGVARSGLKATLGLAGSSDATRARQGDLLAVWERRTRDALAQAVEGLLSDSLVYTDREAMSDIIHDDFKDD
jgi:hypothetical protein